MDNHWPAVCAAVVVVTLGLLGAGIGVLYVVIRPAKGERRDRPARAPV